MLHIVTLCISQVNAPLRNGPTRAANVQRRRVDDVPAKSLFDACTQLYILYGASTEHPCCLMLFTPTGLPYP